MKAERWKLPKGWYVRRNSTWDGPRLVSRVSIFTCECGQWEQLTVKKRSGIWRLLVNDRETDHHFASAKDAIEYADDVRIHAG